MIHSIFISKEVTETSVLYNFCKENKVRLYGHSFLHFESVLLQKQPTSDALFFTSKRAVSYFVSQHPTLSSYLIACVGQATADELLRLDIHVDFIASKSGKPVDVADQLTHWLNGRSITFISALKSSNSIFELMPTTQASQVAVYETSICPTTLAELFDVYVFTSPSNLDGFLLNNQLSNTAITIAWGETTATAMRERELNPTYVLETASEQELVSCLVNLINQN